MMLSLAFVAAGLLELAPSALATSQANTNIAKRQAVLPRHHESSHSHIKNRRHSKMAKKVKAKKDISVLFSGGGLGTLYYDMNGGGTCGPINGWYSYAETGGYAMCEPNSGYKTLAERGSNRVVAIPSNMLQGNQAKYCGKEISVTYNGNTVNNLILWDGCAACNSNGGLDFSSTVFAEVFGESNCGAGKLGGMTWEILDRQIWSTDGTPVAGGGDSSPNQPEPSSTWSAPSSTSASSSTTEQEEPSTSSTWVEPSTTSSSSTWAPSEVSSSSTRTPKPKPSKISDAKTEEPVTVVAPTKSKPVFVAKPSSASSSQAEEVAPTTTSAAEEEPAPEPTSSATPSSSPAPSPEPISEDPAPVDTPSDGGVTSGNSCGVAPGTWQCSGNYLRQCVQTLSGWEWLNRVECAEGALINCDSPNPVCTRYIGKRRLPLF